MAVTASNLILGAATLYIGTDVAVEPTDAVAALGTGWTDLGGTTDGVTIAISQEYTELVADQVVDRIGSRMVSRTITVSTNLAEVTLNNLKTALNGGTVTSTSGKETYDAAIANSKDPGYFPLIIEGLAPEGKSRRVILRKALQTGDVEFAYSKEDQTVLSVEFTVHFVDGTTPPFSIIDEVAV